MLARRLRSAGLFVKEAEDGDQVPAVWQNGEGPYDLLVSDVQMRRWSGLRALAWLRKHGDDVPALMVTSFGDARTHQRAARLGAAVLDKPFDLCEFEDRVLDLLTAHQTGAGD